MELAVTAPAAGRVARVLVSPASRVVAGQPLVLLDTAEHTDDTPARATRTRRPQRDHRRRAPPSPTCSAAPMLGYDLSPRGD
jgi:pyruvate/2-oxoglutarate dehydrogenase complex dihydrolipoamide acyltransferase (E2) component